MPEQLTDISISDFNTKIFEQWDSNWLLLTCGDFQSAAYNAMTVAWGSFGVMWNLPIVMVVVRPSRYTFKFLNDFDAFTLCGFPPRYKKALTLLGTKSGRDCDKIKESGLTPVASEFVSAPSFKEACLSIACRKIYFDDFKPEQFLDDRIEKQYKYGDYHRMVFGEILNIQDDPEKYRKS